MSKLSPLPELSHTGFLILAGLLNGEKPRSELLHSIGLNTDVFNPPCKKTV